MTIIQQESWIISAAWALAEVMDGVHLGCEFQKEDFEGGDPWNGTKQTCSWVMAALKLLHISAGFGKCFAAFVQVYTVLYLLWQDTFEYIMYGEHKPFSIGQIK